MLIRMKVDNPEDTYIVRTYDTFNSLDGNGILGWMAEYILCVQTTFSKKNYKYS